MHRSNSTVGLLPSARRHGGEETLRRSNPVRGRRSAASGCVWTRRPPCGIHKRAKWRITAAACRRATITLEEAHLDAVLGLAKKLGNPSTFMSIRKTTRWKNRTPGDEDDRARHAGPGLRGSCHIRVGSEEQENRTGSASSRRFSRRTSKSSSVRQPRSA